MEKLELYDIDLKNFNDSSRVYTYKVSDDFFETIEAPGINKGDLEVQLSVKKGIGYFTLDFHIEGVVECLCDRCLDALEVDVDTDDTLKVKLGLEYDDSDDEMLIVPENEGLVNVAWYIYEFAYLSLPYRKVHEDGMCNEEMMDTLNHVLTTEAVETDSEYDDEDEDLLPDNQGETDPRWDALKKILNNN